MLKRFLILFTDFDEADVNKHPIPNKQDALLDYYFTEKINDCFLCYTIPLYYGCTNVDKFFPPQSYIKINLGDIKSTARIINEELSKSDYQERLPYLQEAREAVIKKHHYQNLFENEIMPVLEKNSNQPFVKHTLKKTQPNFLWRLAIMLRQFLVSLR